MITPRAVSATPMITNCTAMAQRISPSTRTMMVMPIRPSRREMIGVSQKQIMVSTDTAAIRDRGKHVLLLMDSLTRFAMAQREIALAIGEPPATKGYPPSVFSKLSQLVERSGNGLHGQGSITAFYTVLSEGDDQQDPVADAARGILDGHIVLSRDLAEGGHYPAIDVERSVSRVMTAVAGREHLQAARRMRQLMSKLSKARDLIQLGAYQSGHDAELDAAVRLQDAMSALLQQDMHDRAPLEASRAQLCRLMAAP